RLPRLHNATESSLWTRSVWSVLPELGKRRRYPKHCGRAHSSILESKQNAKIGLADTNRIRQHGLEHGLKLAGGTADDPEDLRGRRLLLQRLAQLDGAIAQLVHQPGVLDRDDGLLGEARDQRNLLVGEWPDLVAIDGNQSDHLFLFEHRHSN